MDAHTDPWHQIPDRAAQLGVEVEGKGKGKGDGEVEGKGKGEVEVEVDIGHPSSQPSSVDWSMRTTGPWWSISLLNIFSIRLFLYMTCHCSNIVTITTLEDPITRWSSTPRSYGYLAWKHRMGYLAWKQSVRNLVRNNSNILYFILLTLINLFFYNWWFQPQHSGFLKPPHKDI